MSKRDKQRQLSRLIEDERIHFHELEDVQPGNHSHIFDAIHELGRSRFESYSSNLTHEAHLKPWRARTKAHVQRIVSLAESCRRAQQNEDGWRLTLEHEIFARFYTEVTCKRCSGKLWRSEVEVLLNPSDEYGEPLRLDNRQAMRRPCTCKDLDRYMDREDSGVCRIFHYRADTAVKYRQDDPLEDLLPSEQRPDRVYGYHETKRFSKCLNQRAANSGSDDRKIREILECSPFDEPRDPVLFPFLVLEAKSESGNSFDSVEEQTAFSIKKLLDLQHRLKSATGPDSQWESGPLAWFLSNRGDEWRVAVAYPEPEGASSSLHYVSDPRTSQIASTKALQHIYQLWNGSLRSKDGALQLSLIMDYIWDWARDSHREAVLGELRILAGKTGISFSDSDIQSLGDRMTSFLYSELDTPVEEKLYSIREDALDHLETNETVYWRPISRFRAQFSGLCVDRKTLGSLLFSFNSKREAQRRARQLLNLLNHAWRVTSEALEALELMWTGTRRDEPKFHGSGRIYYAVFNMEASLATDWKQVLDLTYIAVAADALDHLRSLARHPPTLVSAAGICTVDQEQLVSLFQEFRQTPPRARLHACIRQASYSSRNLHKEATNDVSAQGDWTLDVLLLRDEEPLSREIFVKIYNQCVRGMREPDEPFLKVSSCFEKTHLDIAKSPSVWDLGDCPIDNAALQVLLVALQPPTRVDMGGIRSLCICFLDDIPGPRAFPLKHIDLSKCAFEFTYGQLRHLTSVPITAGGYQRWRIPERWWAEVRRREGPHRSKSVCGLTSLDFNDVGTWELFKRRVGAIMTLTRVGAAPDVTGSTRT